MLSGFESLSPHELDALLLAPLQIVALVGAADGDYNQMEAYWASEKVRTKTIGRAKFLRPYWEKVNDGFSEKVSILLSKVPEETEFRNKILAEALAECNAILAKLDPMYAGHLYQGFLDLAEETAVASGGFMRIGAINSAERTYYKLPMLTPIVAPPLPKDQWQIEEEEREAEKEQ